MSPLGRDVCSAQGQKVGPLQTLCILHCAWCVHLDVMCVEGITQVFSGPQPFRNAVKVSGARRETATLIAAVRLEVEPRRFMEFQRAQYPLIKE